LWEIRKWLGNLRRRHLLSPAFPQRKRPWLLCLHPVNNSMDCNGLQVRADRNATSVIRYIRNGGKTKIIAKKGDLSDPNPPRDLEGPKNRRRGRCPLSCPHFCP
jgi:hypothetical protein